MHNQHNQFVFAEITFFEPGYQIPYAKRGICSIYLSINVPSFSCDLKFSLFRVNYGPSNRMNVNNDRICIMKIWIEMFHKLWVMIYRGILSRLYDLVEITISTRRYPGLRRKLIQQKYWLVLPFVFKHVVDFIPVKCNEK